MKLGTPTWCPFWPSRGLRARGRSGDSSRAWGSAREPLPPPPRGTLPTLSSSAATPSPCVPRCAAWWRSAAQRGTHGDGVAADDDKVGSVPRGGGGKGSLAEPQALEESPERPLALSPLDGQNGHQVGVPSFIRTEHHLPRDQVAHV